LITATAWWYNNEDDDDKKDLACNPLYQHVRIVMLAASNDNKYLGRGNCPDIYF